MHALSLMSKGNVGLAGKLLLPGQCKSKFVLFLYILLLLMQHC